MADSAEITTETEKPGLRHRFGVGVDGLYTGIITTAALPGYLVDAVNHAPRTINILPGEQGLEPMTDNAVMGSAWIRRNLTAAYEGYNDVTGVDVPERIDTADHIIGLGGEVAGGALIAGGIASAASASPAIAGGVQRVAGGVTAIQESSVMSTTGNGALRTAWWGARHPLIATTGLAAADVGLNDSDISGGLIRKGMDWGIRKTTGFDDLTQAWREAVPQGIQDALHDGMVFMGENPALAKWSSFALVLLGGNSLLGSIMGSNFISQLMSFTISGLLAWGVSNSFRDAATAAYRKEQGIKADAAAPVSENAPGSTPVLQAPAAAAPG